jgi:putative ABC transport system permease protein
VVLAGSDQARQEQTSLALQRALEQHGMNITMIITTGDRQNVVDGHFLLLVYLIIAMAALMAVVGMLGLASAMSTSVVERSREFGIMKAIGSRPRTIIWSVISEGSVIGLLSVCVALVLSLPLALLIGSIVSSQYIFVPLPLVVSPQGIVLWLALVIVGASAASALPAWNASRLTVRETLAYV